MLPLLLVFTKDQAAQDLALSILDSGEARVPPFGSHLIESD